MQGGKEGEVPGHGPGSEPEEAARWLAEALDVLGVAAFTCDEHARVIAATGAAQRLLVHGCDLLLDGGRLRLSSSDGTAALDRSIRGVLRSGGLQAPPENPIVVHRLEGPPLILDVVPLPVSRGDESAPRVLVVAGRERAAARSRRLLQAAYGLTPAEIEVAVGLAAGCSPVAIAEVRGVRVGTVRAQIKTLLGKLRVRRQGELVALLHRLGV